MQRVATLLVLIYIVIAVFITGCKGTGEKTDLSFIEIPNYEASFIAYAPIQPAITGFTKPVDCLIGYDEILYVLDIGAEANPADNKIISFDLAGRKLGEVTIFGATALAMDRRLNLLVTGLIQTNISGQEYQLAAIYRIRQSSGIQHGLQYAAVSDTIVHPFYFRQSFTASDANVRFGKIATFGDSAFYVIRTGPNTNTNQVGGPDDAVILFRGDNRYEDFVRIQTSFGELSDYFRKPVAITSLAKPPQLSVTNSADFIIGTQDPANSLRVQYIEAVVTEIGTQYLQKPLAVGDTTKADGFLYTPERFTAPLGLTVTGDGTNYLFVVDADKDSLYQFTLTGLEGVKPPPSQTNSTKQVKVSFGGLGSGLTQFKNPQAVTYFDRILYVCDTDNARILRFKLTPDFL